MEGVKIIEGLVIMIFFFLVLCVLASILLTIFMHIYFHRSGLAQMFYDTAAKENVFFAKNIKYNTSGLMPSSWKRFKFILKWCLNEEYTKEDSLQTEKIKKTIFISQLLQLASIPLSLLWILLCLVTIVLTFFIVMLRGGS